MQDSRPGPMRGRARSIGFAVLVVTTAAGFFLPGCTRAGFRSPAAMIDLTHPFDENTVYWPTARTFDLTRDHHAVTAQGYFYSANSFCAAEHGGTHIDAPIHFNAEGQALEAVPLERLIGPGVVVDVQPACAADRDYQVSVADFEDWERRHRRRLDDVIVLLRTGFGRYYPDRTRYMGTDQLGPPAVAGLHFPGLHPDAASWLVEHRRIKAIGIDTPSIDHGPSKRFDSHVRLFARNVPAFENVAHLDELPETGFTVLALPMKIRGGSGGPLRIVALLD